MNYYFISPHLDDAIFSAGNLIYKLREKAKVTIITIFTKVTNESNTLFTHLFIKKSGFCNSRDLFSARKDEDIKVCRSIGVNAIHLDFVDLAWRKKRAVGGISLRIPELSHLYPTRFHILGGKIHKEDEAIMKKITQTLKNSIKNDDAVVFCPLGIGNQVDHIITRTICQKSFLNVIYWQDYPYVLKNQADQRFIKENNLETMTFCGPFYKKELMLGYTSQIQAYFKDKKIKNVTEHYYSSSPFCKRSLLNDFSKRSRESLGNK